MAPRIQHTKTEYGESIAYWTLGEGTPLVCVPLPASHIELEWQWPEWRHWYERLAEGKGFLFADRGEEALSGFEDPVRLYELSWRA